MHQNKIHTLKLISIYYAVFLYNNFEESCKISKDHCKISRKCNFRVTVIVLTS